MAVTPRDAAPPARIQARAYKPVGSLPTNSLQQSAIAIIVSMTALALLMTVLRVATRLKTKRFGLDDALASLAMVFSLGLTVPYYMFIRYDYIGFRTVDLPEDYDLEPMLFWNWIMQIFYNPILSLIKSSILIFMHRLGGHQRNIRLFIHSLNAFNVLLMIAIFLTVIFQTIPINAYWDLTIKRERQIDGLAFYMSTAIITIITDVLVLAIPIWVFAGLKMKIGAKVGLIVVFLMGGIVTIVGIIRIHEFRKKFTGIEPGYDARHGLGDTLSSVEVNLAIIASCGPALRPLFRKLFPRLFTTSKSTKDRADYGYKSGGGGGYGTGTGKRQTVTTSSFPLKDMHHTSKTHTVIRGHSPNGSEEEIMTYNGIIRTTAVDVKYDNMSDDREFGRDSGPDMPDPVYPRAAP